MNPIYARLRSHRLAPAFLFLAILSAAIVGGSYAAHGVRGQERTSDSSDATPLKVANSQTEPNAFVKIAKAVGPAVVNINTQTLPKSAGNKGGRRLLPNPHNRVQPNPQNPGDNPDDDDQDQGGQGQNNFQDFFNRFFGGQMPDQGDGG